MRLLAVMFMVLQAIAAANLSTTVSDAKQRNTIVRVCGMIEPSDPETCMVSSGVLIGADRVLSISQVVPYPKLTSVEVEGNHAHILLIDYKKDLLLLSVPDFALPFFPPVRFTTSFPRSKSVFLVWGRKDKTTHGTAKRVGRGCSSLESNISAAPGAGGGGYWDTKGRLVGIVGDLGDERVSSEVIPACQIRRFLAEADRQ